MYITDDRVFGGTPNILIFCLFLDNLSISEQTIDMALPIHIEQYNYDSMKKNRFIWFSPYTVEPRYNDWSLKVSTW